MKGKRQPLRSGESKQRSTEPMVGIIGGLLVVLGVFIGVRAIQTYIYLTAHSTTQGTAQASADIIWTALGIIIWPILAFIFVTLLISEVLEKSLFSRPEGIRKEAKWSLPSISWTRQSTAWAIGFVGASLIALIISIGAQNTQAAYAFYNTARSSTEGTVQNSHEEDNTSCSDTCTDVTNCTTIVTFTPPSQSTSFTTTDDQCNILAKGTKVEVLYDPRDPSIAKTPRQASADITNTIIATIMWPIIVFFFVAPVIGGLLTSRK